MYHLSLLTGTHTYLPFAERCRTALFFTNASATDAAAAASTSSSTSSASTTETHTASASASASATPSAFAATAAHFSSDGWLTPVVNPDAYGVQGANSPEGEAFVLQLHSAWRDWVADGAEETLGFLLVGGGGEEGERSGFYFVLVEGTVGGDVGHFGTCMCGC